MLWDTNQPTLQDHRIKILLKSGDKTKGRTLLPGSRIRNTAEKGMWLEKQLDAWEPIESEVKINLYQNNMLGQITSSGCIIQVITYPSRLRPV